MHSKNELSGLYHPSNEHDSCGTGFVAHIQGAKSHRVIEQGLQILKNLDHRGAVGADPLMGDGAGILFQIPDQFFREEMKQQGITLPPVGEYGVGMVFLPKEHASRIACEQALERAVRAEGQRFLGWRDVPVASDMPMSPTVKAREPSIRQIFIGRGSGIMVTDALERKLYVIRKTSSHAIQQLGLAHGKEYFVPSMSARTIVYKGLLLCDQVGHYYKDLSDPRVISAIALVHQRFSTNTLPEWPLAHPYRLIAHNGEINTIKGNYNWLRAREGAMHSPVLDSDLEKIYPIVYPGQSDTATFDNCLELLVMAGYPLAHAMMMMIPEAWEQDTLMDPKLRAFYEFHAAMMEPWDGPAAIVFSDGRQIGAMLDRNGLRPARYCITDDNTVVLSSEAGVLPIPEARIAQKWRLQPGKILLIDLEQGKIIDDSELKQQLANSKPYREWIETVRIKLDKLSATQIPYSTNFLSKQNRLAQQKAFGYTQEEVRSVLAPMIAKGEEAVCSMGNDAPLSVLSSQNKTLYSYFKQLFAQVTNPPIDPIREQLVMSLVSFIGPRPNLLDINHTNPPIRLEAPTPILNFEEIAQIRHIHLCTGGKFSSHELDISYPVHWGEKGIEARIASLAAQAEDAVQLGYNILILSDRNISEKNVAIPALLATSAVHLHLVNRGLRTRTGLVIETGSAREIHHFALLGSYGAEAIHPYLAMETAIAWAHENQELFNKTGDTKSSSIDQIAVKNYTKAIGKGLLKIMSKMGISTYMSYCGAQIFEAVGLGKELTDRYFTGTFSPIGGLNIFQVAREHIALHKNSFPLENQNTTSQNPFKTSETVLEGLDLASGGEYAVRANGEKHLWTAQSVAKLQHAVRSNHYETYQEYAALINDQQSQQFTLRGLLDLQYDTPVPLDEVEPASSIVRRFVTGAMSLGSVSTEAHTTLALAMNRIGGKSNTGEGGEDPKRYQKNTATEKENPTHLRSVLGEKQVEVDILMLPGDSLRSRIKQVASGRFGVTAAYLASADQIQIKMAQGAKPGEGGQLPGDKVSQYIAALRYSIPGVGLISPPPHHDIYSIEDLAQLIHDLKNVNPRASVSVKLVSEVGVGTIAAGVSKAKADHIVISGHDGGTGAAPLSSIKYAGSPWELGLAETQQTLMRNGLRSRVTLQADGQLKTGFDVVVAALLGADEFGFATAPLVAAGCIMMRKCHLNTCPVGIATQDPVLRKKFQGQPEHVVNFFFFIATEVRALMAQMGFRRFESMIGRTDRLKMKNEISHWKAQTVDLSKILYVPTEATYASKEEKRNTTAENTAAAQCQSTSTPTNLDDKLIEMTKSAIEQKQPVSFITSIRNIDRSVGAKLSGAIVERYGHAGLPDHTIHLQLNGTAGQSFGAFLAHGITLDLMGEANDYVGKSLSGGRIIVRPPHDFRGCTHTNVIVGNTVLYGAIEGEAFFAGIAGERFAVRNSGCSAVVEGTGDHGCEYMTGGTVVVLGNTGRNFAAGMSAGIAYVYDPTHRFKNLYNKDSVSLCAVLSTAEQLAQTHAHTWHLGECDETILKRLIEKHFRWTGSHRARLVLGDWDQERSKFLKVLPKEYQHALSKAPKEKSLNKLKNPLMT